MILKKIKSLFNTAETIVDGGDDSIQLATATLLVYAMRLDGHTDDREIAMLEKVLKRGFDMTDEEVSILLTLANAEEEDASDLFRWTSVINAYFNEHQKMIMIENLWLIVLSDGKIDDFEANLLRRVSGLIHVSDLLSGVARKKAEMRIAKGEMERENR